MEPKAERKGLGQVIRALRELEGMSREDLAARAELGVDMIAKVEQGAKSPSTAALNRIAQVLGVDAVELSNRGLAWASLLDSPQASTAVLRAVSTTPGVAYSILRGGRAALPSAAKSAALPALAIGAAGAGFAYLADKRVRKEAEDALRKLLEERLKDATTVEDLEQLAEALEITRTGPDATPSDEV